MTQIALDKSARANGPCEHNAIVRRNRGGKCETTLRPDTMSIASDGYLYFFANQLHRQPNYHDAPHPVRFGSDEMQFVREEVNRFNNSDQIRLTRSKMKAFVGHGPQEARLNEGPNRATEM